MSTDESVFYPFCLPSGDGKSVLLTSWNRLIQFPMSSPARSSITPTQISHFTWSVITMSLKDECTEHKHRNYSLESSLSKPMQPISHRNGQKMSSAQNYKETFVKLTSIWLELSLVMGSVDLGRVSDMLNILPPNQEEWWAHLNAESLLSRCFLCPPFCLYNGISCRSVYLLLQGESSIDMDFSRMILHFFKSG